MTLSTLECQKYIKNIKQQQQQQQQQLYNREKAYMVFSRDNRFSTNQKNVIT
ncbi:hypothetical protein Glove_162g70 [Diversispora epigaea]|uniref:Uncharacterized protein n=1 Tax=Diversispora epigaea TaxID=1348612 RepID=A0A397IRC3_9GLOM|nr:hypothetical protein Glove_162g70 [Diversispora epigaea]